MVPRVTRERVLVARVALVIGGADPRVGVRLEATRVLGYRYGT